MTTTDRARKYLASCPPAISGSNGHGTTYTVAVALTNGFSLSRDDALSLLREYNASCSPPWSERELAHKIDQAIAKPHDKPRGHLLGDSTPYVPQSAFVSPSGKFRVNRAAFEAPPAPAASSLPSGYQATRRFLEAAFRPDEWVCICTKAVHDEEHGKWTPGDHGTFMPLRRWLDEHFDGKPNPFFEGREGGAWIRVNPTLPDQFVGSDKKVSAYRHVLVEFDDRPKPEQLAIMRECNLPITAVIDSGGKSLHAWVRIDATDLAEWTERRDVIYEYLGDAGIDAKNKNPSRFSRLPGIMRGKVEQSLIEMNIGQPTWQEWVDWRELSEVTEPSRPSELLDYDVEHDVNNVLGNRWLCKGGSMVLVGQSGVGKSSFTMQFALTIATGRPFFGIKPIRPLRVALIQAENDKGDMAEALQGVVRGMALGDQHLSLIEENVRFYDECVKTGADFIRLARSIIVKHRADVIIADPLLAYTGGDISQQEFMSAFLRNQLNPVLQETGAIWVWIHHMPKPPKGDAAKGTVSDLAYAGAGSADLTNWAREVMVLQREGDDPTFSLTLTKRGKRAGLTDDMGTPATKIRLQHSATGICWEYAKKKMFTVNRGTAHTV